MWTENSVSEDNYSASLSKPHDAEQMPNSYPGKGIFNPHLAILKILINLNNIFCFCTSLICLFITAYSGIGYQNGYRAEQGTCFGNHSNNQQGFCPIRSPSPTDSVRSVSPCDPEYELEYPGATELIVSNLDYNISPREWKHILLTTFHPHVKVS